MTLTASSPPTTSEMEITPSFSPELSSLSFGLVKTISHVSTNVLFQQDMNMFNASGKIAIAVAPGGTEAQVFDNYAQTSSNSGDIHSVDGLERIQGMYQGPFTKGASAFLVPRNEDDEFLWPPEQFLTNNWSMILLAGQVTGSSNLTGPVEIGQLTVQKVYEYEPSSTAVEIENCFAKGAIRDDLYQHLPQIPQTGENPIHLKKFGQFLKQSLLDGWGIAKPILGAAAKETAISLGKAALGSMML